MLGIRQRNGRELHERAIAGRVRIDVSGERLPRSLEALKGAAGRVADIEALTGAR
jgi:hypothetical protein